MDLSAFLQIDFPALITACLVAVNCSLTGCFLVLKRQAMMGDALSHMILPGIVLGYLFLGGIDHFGILIGALSACLFGVVLIFVIEKLWPFDQGTILGIVFSSMFALGVLLLEVEVGSRVHLDIKHALYGALELTYWPGLETTSDLFRLAVWKNIPDQIVFLGIVLCGISVFIMSAYKELTLAIFDPLYAKTIGRSPSLIYITLLFISAIAAVAAFETVGSILVLTFFVCPAATARLITDRLSTQLWLSVVLGIFAVLTGYALAVCLPSLWGAPSSLNAAGMIAVTSGVIFLIVMLFAPQYGLGVIKRMQECLPAHRSKVKT